MADIRAVAAARATWRLAEAKLYAAIEEERRAHEMYKLEWREFNGEEQAEQQPKVRVIIN